MFFFLFIGTIGLLLISYGLLVESRKRQDILDIIGGICLLVYSISIKDPLFIILQCIFIVAALIALWKIKKEVRKVMEKPSDKAKKGHKKVMIK